MFRRSCRSTTTRASPSKSNFDGRKAMSALTLTQHAVLRMSQRSIRLEDLELAEFIGTEVEGGCLVRRKDVQAFERALKKLVGQARRLSGKRVVRAGDVIVSAYHATRGKERRLLRRA
jgi:hypothetical protein